MKAYQPRMISLKSKTKWFIIKVIKIQVNLR